MMNVTNQARRDMTLKRKADEVSGAVCDDFASKKQQVVTLPDDKSAFRSDLFDSKTLQEYKTSYAKSNPYPHAVVSSLIDSELLRNVRSEITTHIHFTLKETDIYRIHQSGDLANLSNLDADSLRHLPSLVRLRNALYSQDFREWVSQVTGAGKVSGQKTDMAVNIYTPGSYLLCHDDVIGSRRVSYILYLTDPDHPWEPDWGGGLRLYPTEIKKNIDGEDVKVPLPEHSLNIPLSFGQLSFFAVRPGESYHDVEEVYHSADAAGNKNRIRMAISGWYHIPQDGEEGYEEGVEQTQAQQSSLMQLKGAAHEFDEPQTKFKHFDEPRIVMNSHATAIEIDPGEVEDDDEDILTEQDLTFLLQYIRAQFLAPDMIEQISESFEDTSMLQLEQFLCDTYADELRKYIEAVELGRSLVQPQDDPSNWRLARPPHKHRYAYLLKENSSEDSGSPLSKLLVDLLHSHAFKKWLALATGLKARHLARQFAIARRFRHGKDYALATAYQGEQPQLEFTISLTPGSIWEQEAQRSETRSNGHDEPGNGVRVDTLDQIEYGGEEVYMAGEDDDDESVHSKSLPQVGKRADPAVYRSAADDEDDSILFANIPTWNRFSAVLRDKGTLRFVKYISHAAKCDRWDVKGEVELTGDAFDGEDDETEVSEQLGDDLSDEDGNTQSRDDQAN